MIETERLLLRPPEPTDLDPVYRLVSDPNVMCWLSRSGSPETREDAAARIERWTRAWEIDGFGHFIVVRRDPAAVIGRVGFLVWADDPWSHGLRAEIGDRAEIELGWSLESAAWGRGYATEAARAARDWGLEHVEMRRLISLIDHENVRSQRVAEKIGERYRHDIVLAAGGTLGLWQLASPR
ncbi:MAG: GNAT family N-acetyltransferase [Actinobacteria bacterium]|nr:GNAT family N-acetyltransferase [Actinomycetota bacterium]